MPKLSNAQLDVIIKASRKGGLLVTDAVDGRVVEEVRWHKYVQSTEQEDGSILIVATDAGRAAIAAAKTSGGRRAAANQPTEPAAQPAVAPRPDPKGKLGELVALLRRPGGATIAELTAATGWQAHSVRGALSGALKKKYGLTITSDKTAKGRLYGIPAAEAR
ncbi:MAG TPA: DUF3489 domain-containing protein [Caulobacteraceae bacterium]|nr:DUF3489 domain-containing protein [Caulobacteraceae bacterium]